MSSVVVTQAPTWRAMPAEDLAARVLRLAPAGLPSTAIAVEPDPERAIERALRASATVCVAGSIFLAGAVRDGLRQRAILP